VSKITLGIVPRGDRKLEPSRVIGPLDAPQRARLEKKGRLFDGALEDLESDLT
jgi:hypothetical protein